MITLINNTTLRWVLRRAMSKGSLHRVAQTKCLKATALWSLSSERGFGQGPKSFRRYFLLNPGSYSFWISLLWNGLTVTSAFVLVTSVLPESNFTWPSPLNDITHTGVGPALFHCDLILTNCICDDSFQIRWGSRDEDISVSFQRNWWYNLNHGRGKQGWTHALFYSTRESKPNPYWTKGGLWIHVSISLVSHFSAH